MADAGKHLPSGDNGGNLISDVKNLFSIVQTRRTRVFIYGFMFTFVAVTAFLAFNPSPNSSSPWFNNIFSSSSSSLSISSSDSSFRSQFPNVYSYFFPNSTSPSSNSTTPNSTRSINNTTILEEPKLSQNLTAPSPPPSSPVVKNSTVVPPQQQNRVSNFTASLLKRRNSTSVSVTTATNSTRSSSDSAKNTSSSSNGDELKKISKNKNEGLLRNLSSLINCNIFDGGWVRDDSYPLYPPGSCPHIDEPFNCLLNARPDSDYQKLRWKPKGCDLPRLDGLDMLELLRGKRLVFVGDSLNRNMWESLVCILRNSVKDKSKVFEASGRREFRTEGSYSFVFKDYNCSVEFFRSPFLVQEWEMPDTNGTTKETLRLDLVERSSTKYKDADIIVFNTGHWWTHDKTSKGKDYYQVGNHIFGELNVVEAFHKALLTWAKWVDANVDPNKTHVLFRGYSASHFSGGQWNSGGACDSETKPITNETYLSAYPPKMRVLESVLDEMKTSVFYLNITRMTDYRKDAHPSIYRKKNLSLEERKSPLRYQDCSHWCLPGVPDIWNELLYAEILMQHYRKQQVQQQQQQPAPQKKQP